MKPRVLMLTQRVPYPPDRGDRIRAWQVLQYASRFADVSLGAISDEAVLPSTREKLAATCEQVALVPLRGITRKLRGAWSLACGRSVSQGMFASPELARAIERWHADQPFDAVIVYCSSMFPYVAGGPWHDVPKWVDLVDVDSQKWADYAQAARGPQRWLYARESKTVAALEHHIAREADVIAITTPAEARLLRARCPQSTPTVVENGVDFQYFAPQGESVPARLAFVGVLDYMPNVQGVLWFIEHVWPRIRQAHANATFEIVGRNPVAALRKLHAVAGVSVWANVPDVRPHVAAAELIVAPLQIARGVQNKVLEALAMERAVIATPAACQGLATIADEHLICASSADEWCDAAVSLLNDRRRREQLASAGRRFVVQHHCWNRCLAPLEQWLGQLLGSPASRAFAGNVSAHSATPEVALRRA